MTANNVIPLFVEDEITGVMLPNRPQPAEYWVCTDNNAWSTHKTYNDALNAMYKSTDPSVHIISLPAKRAWRPK